MSAGWPQPQSVPQAETVVLKPVLETPTTGLRAETEVQTLVPARAVGMHVRTMGEPMISFHASWQGHQSLIWTIISTNVDSE